LKTIGLISTAVLALILGVTTPAYAQREQQAEKQDQPKQEQQEHEQAKPEKQHVQREQQSNQRQEHAQRQQQNHNKPQEQRAEQQSNQKREHAQEQERQTQSKQQAHVQQQQRQDQNNRTQHAQQQRGNQDPQRTSQRQHVEHSAWQQHRSRHWDSDHRTWQQRGGYNGYRIPEDRFRGYFGRDHGFRISGLPFLVVGGYPRFQYSGYWFSPVDPWPEYWASDWYDTDDVYVVYIDNGYYMFNHRYPNTGIAIRISL
jgi:hypothetical protein